jgi:DNA-binding transcriptional LysR family regulator
MVFPVPAQRICKAGKPNFATAPQIQSIEIPNFNTNLKQWRILLTVVNEGSFAAAAAFLSVSQPAVSYTIARMEEQLGMRLLRLDGRKCRLTEAGHALLERARHLITQAAALEEMAQSMRTVTGPRVRLAVERGFPLSAVLPVLRELHAGGERIEVVLMEHGRAELLDGLRGGIVDVAISSSQPLDFLSERLCSMEYMAVAHPQHSLLHLGRVPTAAELEREVHVLPLHCEAQEVLAQTRGLQWRVSGFEAAEEIVADGLGYAWLPRFRAELAIRMRRLAPLPLASGRILETPYFLVQGKPELPSAKRICAGLRDIARGWREQIAVSPVH